MQSFDQSLFSLFKSGLITYEEALKRAKNPDDFELKVKGIHSTSDMSFDESIDKPPPKKDEMKIDRFSK